MKHIEPLDVHLSESKRAINIRDKKIFAANKAYNTAETKAWERYKANLGKEKLRERR